MPFILSFRTLFMSEIADCKKQERREERKERKSREYRNIYPQHNKDS